MVKMYRHSNPQVWGKLFSIAREMRGKPTPAENLLWQFLRDCKLNGYKFYQQRPIDRFVVDFCCLKAALIIEVDGEIHLQQVEADQERELILTELGFHVIRFTNAQVLEQTNQVLQQIVIALEDTPSPNSSKPEFGEGAGG